MTEAAHAFAPDLLVADQQALAGPVVARRLGIPWATSASTSAELTRPFADFPKVGEWVSGQIAGFLSACGLPEPDWDPRFSERLVIVFSTPELVGAGAGFPAHFAFVGPAFGARPAVPGFPWQRLDPERRRVLVSLGTLNQQAGGRFYATVLEAAERLSGDVQLVLAAPASLAGPVPGNVLLRERVPQLELLPHLDAVVSHGGHNTVCEALAYGLPLVVAPIRDDQPIVARQVVEAGAGVRVRFGRTRTEELCDALTAVLDDPGPAGPPGGSRPPSPRRAGPPPRPTGWRSCHDTNPFRRVRWTSALTVAALGAGTVRARRRLRAIPVLPAPPSAAAGLPRAAGWRLLTAHGVEAGPATFLAACAHADREGLWVLDLLPADLAAERVLGLLRLVDPGRYREDRLAEGRGAGYAVLVAEEVLARAGVDPAAVNPGGTDPGAPGAGLEPAELLALTRRLKEYAAGSTGLAIAPALSVGRTGDPAGAVRAAELRAQGLPPGALAAAQLAGVALLAGLAARQGRWGAAAAGLYWLQPYLVLGGPGAPLRPADLPWATAARPARSLGAAVRTAGAVLRTPAGRMPTPTGRQPRTGPNWPAAAPGSWSRAARTAPGAARRGCPCASGCPICSRASRAGSRWSSAGTAGTSSRTPA